MTKTEHGNYAFNYYAVSALFEFEARIEGNDSLMVIHGSSAKLACSWLASLSWRRESLSSSFNFSIYQNKNISDAPRHVESITADVLDIS